jgi:hypothetical protein
METAAADTYALTDEQIEFRGAIRQIVAATCSGCRSAPSTEAPAPER